MRLGRRTGRLTVTPAMALIVALACGPAGTNAMGRDAAGARAAGEARGIVAQTTAAQTTAAKTTAAEAITAQTITASANPAGEPAGGLRAGAPARAIVPRASLPVIERQVMCATCKIPLNVAESPQADRERAFILNLIAHGQSEAQIKSALVAQYGPAVLALPSPKGFDLAAYLVPAVAMLALLALLALLLPRWRRHTRAQARAASTAAELSASDAARLDADLRRFD